jgi:hypothetical protein
MIRHGTEPLLENNDDRHKQQRPNKPAVLRNRSFDGTERSTLAPLKSSSSVSPSRRPIPVTDATIHPHQANTYTGRIRMLWVTLGILMGSSLTGIFQSINMPGPCSSESLSTHGDMTLGVNPPEQVLKALQTEIHNFTYLPPPPQLGGKDSFAACLLIKDDNHWREYCKEAVSHAVDMAIVSHLPILLFCFVPVIEWLAYHHFVMPLRHLVIAIDPGSKTSPKKILNRWSKRDLMKIHIWTDKDYMPSKTNYKLGMYDNNTHLQAHRVRQANFYRRCNAFLRREGRDWLMFVDTGE